MSLVFFLRSIMAGSAGMDLGKDVDSIQRLITSVNRQLPRLCAGRCRFGTSPIRPCSEGHLDKYSARKHSSFAWLLGLKQLLRHGG